MFDWKSIPDVLGLMLMGLVIGPVLGLVNPASFGQFGPIFSNLVLLFILFESGTELKISEIRSSLKESAGITIAGFITTWIATSVMCILIFDLSLLTSLFVGAALGGTTSTVVVGLIRKVSVQPKTASVLPSLPPSRCKRPIPTA